MSEIILSAIFTYLMLNLLLIEFIVQWVSYRQTTIRELAAVYVDNKNYDQIQRMTDTELLFTLFFYWFLLLGVLVVVSLFSNFKV